MTDHARPQLAVPDLWNRDGEWDEAIIEADEAERPFVERQKQLSSALRRMSDAEASPENLAWLSLWSRAFSMCDGARGAVLRESLLTLTALERMAFKLSLQVGLAFEEPSSVTSRLRAHAAWCLNADIRLWEAFLSREHLDRAFDPSPGRELVAALDDRAAAWSQMFGEVEELSDQEAEFDRRRYEDYAKRRLAALGMWYSDKRLASWRARIAALEGSRQKTLSFYALFDQTERSVFDRLRGQGTRFAYLAYRRGSAAIHGSTVEDTLHWSGPRASPLIGADSKALRETGEKVHAWVQWCTAVLGLMGGDRGAS